MPSKRKRDAEEGGEDDAPDKQVCLLVEHTAGKEEYQPAFSIIKFNAAAATPAQVVTPLRHPRRGTAFVAVDSRWILGLGGEYQRHVTIYDVSTSRARDGGPLLRPLKMEPVLIQLRGTVYALSRRATVHTDVRHDFVPWFEAFSFIGPDGPRSCLRARELPPPPIFPCRINPLEYLDPPDVRVASYAVVGSHILISVSVQHHEEEMAARGTCAFDVDRQVWEMVDDMNLPFLGQAVPLGNNLFVARSKGKDGTPAVYYMNVSPPRDTASGKSELSIIELRHKGRIVPGQLLCASGKGSFSSFDVRSADPSSNAKLDIPRVIHRTYSLVNGVDDSRTNTVIVKQQRQLRKVYKLPHGSRLSTAFAMKLFSKSSFRDGKLFDEWCSTNTRALQEEDCQHYEAAAAALDFTDMSADQLLLFDLTNEALLDIYKKYSVSKSMVSRFSSFDRPKPVGQHALKVLCSEVSCHLDEQPRSSVEIDAILSNDLARCNHWVNFQRDSDHLGNKLADLVLDKLLAELTLELAEF